MGKLKKKYWKKEHLKEKSIIIAIADFCFDLKTIELEGLNKEQFPLYGSNTALVEYLYGDKAEISIDSTGNVIPVHTPIEDEFYAKEDKVYGFFNEPESENISAVIFNEQSMIDKFNRMGKLAGFGSDKVKIEQLAQIYNPDPKASAPLTVLYEVEIGKYQEIWATGINVYHNPNAKHPIELDLFPNAVHHYFEDNMLVAEYYNPLMHQPYWSIDKVFVKE